MGHFSVETCALPGQLSVQINRREPACDTRKARPGAALAIRFGPVTLARPERGLPIADLNRHPPDDRSIETEICANLRRLQDRPLANSAGGLP